MSETTKEKVFYIDEEKGTVIAKYKDEDVPKNFLMDLMDLEFSSNNLNLRDFLWDELYLGNNPYTRLYGKSQVKSPDEFNAVTGKDIAGMRLDYKLHMRMAKQCDKLIKKCEKDLVKLRKLSTYHYKKCWNIKTDYYTHYMGQDEVTDEQWEKDCL